MGRHRSPPTEERLIPLEAACNIGDANDLPPTLHKLLLLPNSAPSAVPPRVVDGQRSCLAATKWDAAPGDARTNLAMMASCCARCNFHPTCRLIAPHEFLYRHASH